MSYVLKEVDDGNAKLIPGGVRENVVEQLFKMMDKNEDGFLQEDEMQIPDKPQDGGVKEELWPLHSAVFSRITRGSASDGDCVRGAAMPSC